MDKEIVCQSCGATISEGDICPKCGTSVKLESYGYSIMSSPKGGGFLLYCDEKPVSLVRESLKWLDETSRKYSIPINSLETALLNAKNGTFSDEEEGDEPNPGAVIVLLAQTHSEAIFKDQLDETYITYIEKRDIGTSRDMDFSIVLPSTTEYIEECVSTEQRNNRDSHVPPCPTCPNEIEILRTVRIKSRECKQWLAKLYYRDQGKAAGSDTINSAILVLEAQATEKRLMYNRVAPDGEGGLWWDMCDELCRAIHVTKNGWEIVDKPPQIFKKYPHQLSLAVPSDTGTLKPLLEYAKSSSVNHQILRVITPLTYLIPEVPHVIELLGGPKGVTKSSSHRFTKMVIDPSATPLLMMPRKENLDQMVQHGDHHYLLIYDNVTKIEEDQSDLLCRMVTGLGFAKRMLYTDDDTVIRQYQRCVAINGINIPVDKADLLDRSVLYVAEPLDDKDRKTERHIKKKMEDDAPKVIRGILDTLVRALNIYDEVTPTYNNRMADYTRWGCAICQAIGLDYKYFERAYQDNIRDQNEEAIKSSPVADWLIQWYEYTGFKKGYSGTPSELFNSIEDYAKVVHEKDLKWVDNWPKGTRAFGQKLTEVIPSLEEAGFHIVYKKSGSTRKYVITRVIDDKEDTDSIGQRSLSIAVPDNKPLTEEMIIDAIKEIKPCS